MPITIVGTTETGSGFTTNVPSFVIPTGVAVDDVVYAFVALKDNRTLNTPTGWTRVGTALAGSTSTYSSLFSRTITSASEGGTTVSFTAVTATYVASSAVALRGAGAATVFVTGSSAASTAVTIPALTPTVDNHLSLAFVSIAGANPAPALTLSGWTQDAYAKSNTQGAAIVHNQYAGGANVSTGTASGTTATSTAKAIFRLAVEPALTGVTVDVTTVTATVQSVEATQVSPIHALVDVATATASTSAVEATQELRKHPVIAATREKYSNSGGALDSASNVVGSNGYVYAADIAIPSDFTNAGKISAFLKFTVATKAGIDTNYYIQAITQPWASNATAYELSDEFVTVSLATTGAKSVDVSSLVRKTNFYGFAFSSRSADEGKYVTIPDGTNLDLYYAVVGEGAEVLTDTAIVSAQSNEAAVVVDLAVDTDTAQASAQAAEATAEATTDPNTAVDVQTAVASAAALDATVSLPVIVDVTDTAVATTAAAEAEALNVSNALVDVDTPTAQVTLVKVADVNGEPVLPTETEDSYFNATLRTVDTGDIWWRLNEASGTKVYNRANPSAEWPATGTGTYDGVTIGQFNGPEGRRSVYFNGAARIEENEPTATNLDEVFYSPNVLEFTFRTERGTQFIMGGADASGVSPSSGVSSPVEASEFWLVDGRINFRAFRLQGINATPQTNTNITGFKNLADGEWHHVVVNAGISNAARGSRAIEIWVDGKLEIRRFAGVQGTSTNESVETSVVYFGMPDYIGGRGEYVDGRRLPQLAVSQWFVGDMTEVVFRNSKILSEDQILLQRDNMFGIKPVYVETLRASAKANEASAKGNKTRILVIDFQTSASMVVNQDYKGVGPMPGRDAFGRILNAPPYQAAFDFPALQSALGDTYGVEGYQMFKAPVRNNYTDQVTDNERVLDLDLDVNLDDYDVLAIGGFPQNDADWQWYTGLDAYSTPPFVPGRLQVENLIAQIRDKVIAGKRLFVNDPGSAVMLGIVDRIEYAANMRERVVNDVRIGSEVNLYDRRAAEIDPWNTNANPAVSADRYRDQHANTRQRVRALVDGLTTIPSYITTDYFEWYSVDPMATPPMQAAFKYADRSTGLFVGDEFYMQGAQGPGVLDGYDESDGTPSLNGRANGWLAAPMANVKVGKAVTSFASKVYNLDKVEDNPYRDYAVSIVVQPGDSWAGRTVQGKVYVNFTEGFTNWAMFYETGRIQIKPTGGDPQHPQSAAKDAWDFSTYRGTWTGTTINPGGQSGGSVLETNTAGNVGFGSTAKGTLKPNTTTLVTFAWQSWWEARNIDLKGMAHRGLAWLATEVENNGSATVNAETASTTLKAAEATVEAQRAVAVDVPTARAQAEAYTDADTTAKDSTVLVGTADSVVRAGAFREVIDLSTASVVVTAIEPDSDLLNGLEIVRLVLPRHAVTLYMEEA